MKKINIFATAIFLSTVLLSCSTASKKETPAPAEKTVVAKPKAATLSPEVKAEKPKNSRVWVAKSDGSKSCAEVGGVKPSTAAKNLKKAGIKVHKFRKGNDGMMHTMQCGGSTGVTIEVLIDLDSLSTAQQKGYEPMLPQPN